MDRDLEILKKREERKKEKYQTLEDGIYMNGKILQFERKSILNTFTLYLPDIIKQMPKEYARIKYPSEFRPQQILTTCDLSVNLGFTVFPKQIQAEIGKIKSWLVGQELYHEYYLIRKKEGLLPAFFHQNLSGVSLIAKVLAVETTIVQVQIQEDENKEKCSTCWFDYATVYSTPDGTGWYCMPEIGDQVRLVFPDQKEEHAYVASSIHIGKSQGRIHPNEKSWKNKQKKEILFTPDAIILRNNKGLFVELSDEKGIQLSSNKDILIRADGAIRMVSQKEGSSLSAKNTIEMQQRAAKIRIKDDILIYGGKIYMN